VIVDSSAVIAILLKEPGYERLRDRLAASEQVSIGAPTVVESSLVLCNRLGHAGKSLLARFLQEAEVEVVGLRPITGRSRPMPSSPTARAGTVPVSTSATA